MAAQGATVERGGLAELPQRRWRIRPARAFAIGAVGALVAASFPFAAWWLSYLPSNFLWLLLLPMIAGWLLALPRSFYLALDQRGVALIRRGWGRDSYVWIPYDRIIALDLYSGWLVATGTSAERQGVLDWPDLARWLHVSIPTSFNLFFHLNPDAHIAIPIHLLDQLARDEIELWLYRQGKPRRLQAADPHARLLARPPAEADDPT